MKCHQEDKLRQAMTTFAVENPGAGLLSGGHYTRIRESSRVPASGIQTVETLKVEANGNIGTPNGIGDHWTI